MALVSVIIVSYNVKYFLEQCLHSIFASTGVRVEVIVVDNNSIDGSVAYLKPLFPQVLFLEQINNPGFATACNIGLEKATGDYVLFLNPDTVMAEDTLISCVTCCVSDTSIGAMGVRMINAQGVYLKESKRGYPSAWASFCKLSGLTSLFPKSRLFAGYYMGYLSPTLNNRVDILPGAYMFMRIQVVRLMQGFDPSFFMYGEDIDLSYRISHTVQLGTTLYYTNFYNATHSIIHYKGESTNKATVKYVKSFYNAMSIFVDKHYIGISGRFLKLFLKLGIVFKKISAFLSLFFSHVFGKKRGPSTPPVYCVVGSINEIETCKSILANAGISLSHILLPKANFPESIIIEDLKKQATTHKIIFCKGQLTYKQIIHLTEVVKPAFPISVFHPRSQSIPF